MVLNSDSRYMISRYSVEKHEDSCFMKLLNPTIIAERLLPTATMSRSLRFPTMFPFSPMVNQYNTLIHWFNYFQAFMERLGLWGDGTAFKSFDSFLASITKRGLGKWHSFQPRLRAVSLFSLIVRRAKRARHATWPGATLSRARTHPSLNLKKKRGCSLSIFSPNDAHSNSPYWSPYLSLKN